MRKLSATVAVVLATLPIAGAAEAKTYLNPEFGFLLDLPENLTPCEVENDVDDHGPIVPLDPRDAGTCSDTTSRNISIFAWHRKTGDTATLQDFLKSECASAGSCTAAPGGLRVAEYRSQSYLVDHEDGWLDIVVLTQGAQIGSGIAHDAAEPVNYSVKLYTDKTHLSGDLATFKAVLRTIHLRQAIR